MLQAVKRICCAECDASNAPRPPEFTTLSSYPLTDNDHAATARIVDAFRAQFGDAVLESKRMAASEDFSVFGRTWGVPYVFWFVGGTDPDVLRRRRRRHAQPDSKQPLAGSHRCSTPPWRRLQAMLSAASRGCVQRQHEGDTA